MNEHPDDEFPGQKKKKRGNGPMILMISLGVLLVGGIVFVLIWFFGGSNYLDSEMLAYMPEDTEAIFGIEVEELIKADKIKSLVGQFRDSPEGSAMSAKMKEAGLTENDIQRVLMGGSFSKGTISYVIRTRKAFDKAKFAQAVGATEQKKGDRTIYVMEDGRRPDAPPSSRPVMKFFMPSDTLIVFTDNDKLFDTLLKVDPGKVSISPEMHEVARKMSKGHLWFAVSSKVLSDRDREGIEKAKGMPAPFWSNELADALKGMKGAGGWLKVDGDRLKLGGGIICDNSDIASKAADKLKEELKQWKAKNLQEEAVLQKMMKEAPSSFKDALTEFQKSVDIDSSGSLLEISAKFNISAIEALVGMFMLRSMAIKDERIQELNKPIRVEQIEPMRRPIAPPVNPLDIPTPLQRNQLDEPLPGERK